MACEKCWSDAFGLMMSGTFESQSEAYRRLLAERVGGNECSPEEVCGVGTTEMHTIHAGANSCACGKMRTEK
jgi:hypothetical protein